jgi:uncharacterized protein (TIGR00255 family)
MPPRQPVVTINEAVLQQLLQALKNAMPDLAADRIDPSALLQVRGVVEVTDESSDPSTVEVLGADILSDLDLALAGVVAMRRQEGAQLRAVLAERVDTMQRLVERAENSPGRKAPAIEARLAAQIAMIMETGASLDPIRLHQEAVLLAAKADIREELDRLKAHIPAARQLIAQGGVIGRRLDFLAQELGRETNTLCAKSNDSELTTIGLELKTVVEQFREQVQNIE